MKDRRQDSSRRRVGAGDARRLARRSPALPATATRSIGTGPSTDTARAAAEKTGLGRGLHLVANGWSAVAERLDDDAVLQDAIRSAIDCIGATLMGYSAHRISSGGISAAALLVEADLEMRTRPQRAPFAAELAASHLVVHTWPERDHFAADLFVSGSADAKAALRSLATSLGAADLRIRQSGQMIGARTITTTQSTSCSGAPTRKKSVKR